MKLERIWREPISKVLSCPPKKSFAKGLAEKPDGHHPLPHSKTVHDSLLTLMKKYHDNAANSKHIGLFQYHPYKNQIFLPVFVHTA